jgi:hypothetical protein
VKSWIVGAAGHARHADDHSWASGPWRILFVRGEKSFDPLLQGFIHHRALLPFDPSTPAANQHRNSPALAAKHSSRSSAAAQPTQHTKGLLAHAEGFFSPSIYFSKLPPLTFSQPQHHMNSIAGSIHHSFITSC